MATDENKPELPQEEAREPPSLAAEQKLTFLALLLAVVASIGGFMFGYVR